MLCFVVIKGSLASLKMALSFINVAKSLKFNATASPANARNLKRKFTHAKQSALQAIILHSP